MFENNRKASPETPWGLPWEELHASLRPAPSDLNNLSAIASTIDDVLRQAGIQYEALITGGAFGKGTLLSNEKTLVLYVNFASAFNPSDYFDKHLKPISLALSASKSPRFSDITQKGLALNFAFEGVKISLHAAGELHAGPKELLLMDDPRAERSSRKSLDFAHTSEYPQLQARAVHIETTCSLFRIALIRMQPQMYKDMVRVAKKWRAGCEFMRAMDAPGDYLLELLMLDAFQGATVGKASSDLYSNIFRRFLALVGTQSGRGSDVLADDAMPKSFLSWTTFYNAGAIEQGIAMGLLEGGRDGCPLVVVDPAVPFVNVARTLDNWGELRKFARDSLGQFQNSELLKQLQTKLNTLSEDMGEMLNDMRRKIEHLEAVEESPRRWSGSVQFKDVHMKGEFWASVTEVKLRTVTWRVNARKARSEGVGYSAKVDVSLQMMGKPLTRTIDVDVTFRGGTSHLVFGPSNDHVLITTNSDVIRNRDYPIQITVVA